MSLDLTLLYLLWTQQCNFSEHKIKFKSLKNKSMFKNSLIFSFLVTF